MKILLVEPSNFFARELYYRLTALGHEVKIATNDLQTMNKIIPGPKHIVWFFHHQLNPYYLRDINVVISFLGCFDNVVLKENKEEKLRYQAMGLKNLIKSISSDAPFRKQKITFIQNSSILYFDGRDGLSFEDSSPGTSRISLYYQELERMALSVKKDVEKLVIGRTGYIVSEDNPYFDFLEKKFLRWNLKFQNDTVYYSVARESSLLDFYLDAIKNRHIQGTYNLVEKQILVESFLEELSAKTHKKTTLIPRWLLSKFVSQEVKNYLNHSLKVASNRYQIR